MPDWFTSEFAINVSANDKSVVILETLEIHHPSFIEGSAQVAIRCVNDVVPHNLKLDAAAPLQAGQVVQFAAIPFEFIPPDIRDGQGAEAKIRVDNILGEVAKYLDDATTLNTPIIVIFRCYLSNDPNTVQLGPWRFECKSVNETGTVLEGSVSLALVDRAKFAREIYDLARFPQLLALS